MKDKPMAELYELLGYKEEVEKTGLQLKEIFIIGSSISENRIDSNFIKNYPAISEISNKHNNIIDYFDRVRKDLLIKYKENILDFDLENWTEVKNIINIALHGKFEKNFISETRKSKSNILSMTNWPDSEHVEKAACETVSRLERAIGI